MANYGNDGHPGAKRIKTDGDRNYNPQANYFGHSNSRYANRDDERVNHVLLITVINPAYPITCDVINQICNPNGKVLRIVIFKKNGVQAMVEFDCIDSAKRAKQALHGCDIYSGCCTLRIEYAKPTRLNVYKNDNESYDYTNPTLGKRKLAPTNWNQWGPAGAKRHFDSQSSSIGNRKPKQQARANTWSSVMLAR